MKKGFWCKLLLCTLMLLLSVVLMASCSTPKKKEEEKKPPKNVTLVVDGVEYDQLQTGDKMPEPPQKDGYDFAGWYDSNDKKVDKIPTSADKDLTLTGKWTPVEYKVTFENTKDAANENAVSFTIESGTITLLPLEKAGYIFDGWYLGGLKIEQILSGTTGNLTLVAQWTPVTYDIVFEGVTGATNQNPGSFTVEDGKIQLSNPARPGYDFNGWYVGSDRVTEIDATAAQSVTVRADWTPIVFDIVFENTKDAVNTNEISFTVESGNIYLSDLEMDGYRFLGWYANNVLVEFIPSGTIGSITLTAAWETVRYDIVFEDTKGAENPNDTYFTVEDDKVTLQPLEKEGYTFLGWYIDNILVTEFDIDVLGTVIITAKWTPHTYDIVFENTKGQSNSNPVQFTPDTNTITLLPLDDKDGYRFVGWYAGNVRVETIPTGTVGNVSLRAEWEAIRYDIVFEGTKDAENPNDTYFTVEDDKVTLQPLEKEGYIFEGWYIDNIRVTEFDVDVLGTVTVTAKWTPLTYNITFENTKDAENGNRTQFTPDDATFELLPLEKAGYTFLGWYVGENKVDYVDNGTIGDMVLEAKWELTVYNITYEGMEDVDFDPENATTYTVESGIVELYNPSKEGYSFDGWYIGGVKVEAIPEGSIGDLTITARWSVVTYTVTLENTKDATDKTELSYTLFKGVKLPTLKLNGYTFDGWYNENDELVTEIVVGTTGDVTVTAKWTATVYNITYENIGENTNNNPATYTIEQEVVLNDLPDGDGTFFGGWYLNGVRVEAIPEGTTGDITLVADWRIPVYTIEDLQNMANLEGNYMLMNDLDLGGVEWTPITFTGSFSGGGHTISNFKITDGSLANVGLFGQVYGTICDLTVQGFEINLASNVWAVYAGGIAGRLENGNLVNCSASGSITVNAANSSNPNSVHAGGLVGYLYKADIVKDCYSECTVYVQKAKNTGYVGGVIGWLGGSDGDVTVSGCETQTTLTVDAFGTVKAGGIFGMESGFSSITVTDCFATGTISLGNSNPSSNRETYVGGIAGSISAVVAISDVEADFTVDVACYAYTYAGGIVGTAYKGSLSNADFHGTINVVNNGDSYYSSYVGGIIGNFSGTVSGSYAEAEITLKNCSSSSNSGSGYGDVGGIAARCGSVVDSSADTTINIVGGKIRYAGGLVGDATSIVDCYANATIRSDAAIRSETAIGGLAGRAVSVKNSHASADVEAEAYFLGVLVGTLGDKYTAGLASDCYATGKLCGHAQALGGIAGYAWSASVSRCWANVTIDATTSNSTTYAGGLLGYLSGSVSGSYAISDIKVQYTGTPDSKSIYAGGLVGCVRGGGVSACYTEATIHAEDAEKVNAGGLVGCNEGTAVVNSYAQGTVYAQSSRQSSWATATTYAGGIVGYNTYSGVVSNCYASVNITAHTSNMGYASMNAGYVVGSSYDVQNCYYDENAVCQYSYAGQEGYTVGVTSTAAGVTATSVDNFKSREWVKENLWSFELDYWLFDGENYPVFNTEFIENSFVEIGSAEELLALSGKTLSLNYKLVADIDLGGAEWTPIVSVNGIFDGNGYKISNFKMTSFNYSDYGFIQTNGGTVRGLALKNVYLNGYIYSSVPRIGLLVAYNRGLIENCGVSGSVSFYSKYDYSNYDYVISVGGLVGQNDGTINGCYSTADVSSSRNKIYTYVGGLVGYNSNGSILNSYATGSVRGELDSSLERGKAYVRVGGLVGCHENGCLEYCYATGYVSSSGASATSGGLVGICTHNSLDGGYLFACSSYVTASSSYYTSADSLADNAPSGLPETYYYLSSMYMSSSKGEKKYTGKARTKSEMIQIMAENWDPSIWTFSETGYPTLSFFAN